VADGVGKDMAAGLSLLGATYTLSAAFSYDRPGSHTSQALSNFKPSICKSKPSTLSLTTYNSKHSTLTHNSKPSTLTLTPNTLYPKP